MESLKTHSELNRFSAIVYINLPHRKDRNDHLLSELKKYHVDPSKIYRIDAIYDPLNGAKGCCQSHIKALDLALENQWENILILEDDFAFSKNLEEVNTVIRSFFNHFFNDWDVFFLSTLLGGFESTIDPLFRKVVFSYCAHCYVVNHHYLQTLRSCYLKAYEKMTPFLFFSQARQYAIDMVWRELQVKDRWYVGVNDLGKQYENYSDIEQKEKSYLSINPILFGKSATHSTKITIIPGCKQTTLDWSVNHLIKLAQQSIEEKGSFSLALSSGSTLNQIYEKLISLPSHIPFDWSKVSLFLLEEKNEEEIKNCPFFDLLMLEINDDDSSFIPSIIPSQNICFYGVGIKKRETIKKIFIDHCDLPYQHFGTKEHKAIWIMDEEAAGDLFFH